MIYENKYLIMFSLLLSAGLAGCIKEREVETPGDDAKRPVVFSPSVSSRATAGHPIENGATIPVGYYHFGVYAWVKPTATGSVTSFAELQNTKVQHASANEYTYNPVASWPRDANAQLACMAYYPWSDQSGNIKVTPGTGANQTMTINYAVPADAGLHVDLMYAKTAMTAGYDPVNLDFRHALARLKFEGRTENFPAASTVKITGIRITNAVMKGNLAVLDPTTQPGKPSWALSTDPGDVGAITMPATHIKDLPLTSALQSVITPGGDMLVLPQSVTGLTVEVTATLNGAAFPEPFVFSLTLSPDWTMNEIITYEITLMPDGMHLTAKVAEWTTDPVNVVYDGQWWLEVSEDERRFGNNGGEFTLTAETNYNISSQGYPAGLQISTEYVSGSSGWLTLANVTGTDGSLAREMKITAANTTETRTAKIKVQAGNLTKIVNVRQVYVPPSYPAYPGVIGYDPDRGDLNLEGRGVMVYFKYGGVVAMYSATNGDIWNAGDIAFNPSTVSISSYVSVPYVSGATSPTHNAANIAAGRGDPCKLIGLTMQEIKSGTRIDNATWRLPTEVENDVQVAFSPANTVWETQASPSDATLRNGQTFSGLNNGTSPNGGWTFLPAAGYRDYSNGTVSGQGSEGRYWSSSPYSPTFGCYLGFNSYYKWTDGLESSYGNSVRCVRQP